MVYITCDSKSLRFFWEVQVVTQVEKHMMDESTDKTDLAAFITLSCGYLLLKNKKKKRKQRRWWVTSLNNRKDRYVCNIQLFYL